MSIENAELIITNYEHLYDCLAACYFAISTEYASLHEQQNEIKLGESAQASSLWMAAKRPVRRRALLSVVVDHARRVIRPGRHPQAPACSPDADPCSAPADRRTR